MNNPLRLLRFLYPASCGGVVLFSAIVAAVSMLVETPIVRSAALWFYSVALASLLAIAAGFWVIRRLERRLPEAENEDVANETILFDHLLAMGAMETSAFLSILATFLSDIPDPRPDDARLYSPLPRLRLANLAVGRETRLLARGVVKR